MALKAGTVDDFAGSMAEAIEVAMEAQWKVTKKFDLPEDGLVDRRILFSAIAQGVLSYLECHQNEVLTSITLQLPDGATQVTFPVEALDLNVGG